MTLSRIKKIKDKIIDESFFRPVWYSIFINPYFINRWSLLQNISLFADGVPAEARVLDIGCGLKPYRSLFVAKEYIGIDIEGGGHSDQAKVVDVYYDGRTVPYPDTSFDVVICTQVLEHADNADMLVAEAARVLRPGGKAFFSMPFMYPEHEVPYDFRRYTSFQHKRIFSKYGFQDVSIQKTTGFFGTFGQLFVVWVFESIKFRAPVLKALLAIFLFAPIQALSLGLDWLLDKSGPTMDYIIIAKK